MIYHKIIRIGGKLKPVCMPDDPKKWVTVPAHKINCQDCLSGRKAQPVQKGKP